MMVRLFQLGIFIKLSFSHKFTNPDHKYLDQLSAPTSPSCQPPQNSDSLISWTSCGIDKNAWYGVTKNTQTLGASVSVCESVGGELVYIKDQDTDMCSYYAMSLSGIQNELVLFSGRYFVAFDEWAWCPNYTPGTQIEDGCIGKIEGYENWANDGSQGDCMGGLIYGNSASFYDYGWEKRNCGLMDQERVKALCRLDCDSQRSGQ